MVKNEKKQEYYDVEIIFADGTSETLNSVKREDSSNRTQPCPEDVVFISKDGLEIKFPSERNILIVTYFSLDCKGHRKHTRPDIEYRNFICIPNTDEEKETWTRKS